MYGTPEALAQLAETNARNAELRAKAEQLAGLSRTTNANGYYPDPKPVELAETQDPGADGPESDPSADTTIQAVATPVAPPPGLTPNRAQGSSGGGAGFLTPPPTGADKAKQLLGLNNQMNAAAGGYHYLGQEY